MREPGTSHVEEFCLLWGFSRVFEEEEGGLWIYEVLYQLYAARAVYVASLAGGPEHQLPLLASTPSPAAPSLRACRAALSAEAASFRKGERK